MPSVRFEKNQHLTSSKESDFSDGFSLHMVIGIEQWPKDEPEQFFALGKGLKNNFLLEITPEKKVRATITNTVETVVECSLQAADYVCVEGDKRGRLWIKTLEGSDHASGKKKIKHLKGKTIVGGDNNKSLIFHMYETAMYIRKLEDHELRGLARHFIEKHKNLWKARDAN